MIDINDIKTAAVAELRKEKFQEEVQKCKERLKRPWYTRIFPWKLTIKIERK
jgi:hypothetical protein